MKALINYWKLTRPYQWVKNLLVFAPLVFGGKLSDYSDVILAGMTFLGMSLIASGMYVFNDAVDIQADRNHPTKKKRPLASGKVPLLHAYVLMILLLGLGLAMGWFINQSVSLTFCVYILLISLYSLYLKHLLLIDVIVIAIGFVIRAIAGAVAISVMISNWLLVTTFFLALFLTIGKRRSELNLLKETASKHRRNLAQYSIGLLDALTIITATTSLMSYALYTLSDDVLSWMGNSYLVYTLPLVVFGLFKYQAIILTQKLSGDPTAVFFKDKQLLLSVLLWVVCVVAIIYL